MAWFFGQPPLGWGQVLLPMLYDVFPGSFYIVFCLPVCSMGFFKCKSSYTLKLYICKVRETQAVEKVIKMYYFYGSCTI